jgi:flagellar assembly protein FliH
VAQAAKFLFDNDFDAGTPAARPIAPAEHAIKLAEAASKGFRDGFAAAEKEGAAVAARRTSIAFEQIGGALQRLASELLSVEQRLEAEAVELAFAIARKLAPELVARQPFAEMSALAADCFRHLHATPHVVVRVSDALLETTRTRLDDIARRCGFDGRLVVVSEPDMAAGDCRIEWADGGIVRTAAKTDAAIGSAIARYLGAPQAAPTPDLNPSDQPRNPP